MKRISIICCVVLVIILAVPVNAGPTIPAQAGQHVSDHAGHPAPMQGQQIEQPAPEGVYNAEAYRSGRRTYTGGRTAPSPGGGTAPGTPVGNVRTSPGAQPGYGYPNRGTGLGGVFGGFAAGALLGSLFHPFGLFGGGGYGTAFGGGLSLLSLIFWGIVIYFVFRLFRRANR